MTVKIELDDEDAEAILDFIEVLFDEQKSVKDLDSMLTLAYPSLDYLMELLSSQLLVEVHLDEYDEDEVSDGDHYEIDDFETDPSTLH
tara:strand:- start:345 stop:608 length:264 start_codon:yes stop_codon:yes gene_type:complete